MSEVEFSSYIENAPEPAPEVEGDVKEAKEQGLEVKIDDVPTSSGETDDGADVVSKLQREVLGGANAESKPDEESGTDIPDEFTNACLKQGWTNDEIVEFASDLDDAALLQLIPEILSMEDVEQDATGQDATRQKGSELGVDQAKQEVKPKPPTDAAKEAAIQELAALKKELEAIKEEMGESKKERTAREDAAIIQTVNQVFDEANKDFEIFGKTDELLRYPAGPRKGQFVPTSPAMIARNDVWEKALPFIQSGIPVGDAMDIALTWYKGKNLEKDVQRNMIKDLKKHESKLSARRTGKETVKVYEDEDERKADVVREAARKAGVKGEYGL